MDQNLQRFLTDKLAIFLFLQKMLLKAWHGKWENKMRNFFSNLVFIMRNKKFFSAKNIDIHAFFQKRSNLKE